jgi:hypothetical protein
MKQAPTALAKANLKTARATLRAKMDIGRKILSFSPGIVRAGRQEKGGKKEDDVSLNGCAPKFVCATGASEDRLGEEGHTRGERILQTFRNASHSTFNGQKLWPEWAVVTHFRSQQFGI